MSIVNQMYVNFCNRAKTIPGFVIGQKEDVKYDITDLANSYVKAFDENNQDDMDRYISALMVRYWHMVPYLWDKSKSSKLDIEDMVMWIYEGLAKAFKYRSWLDPNKEVSKDPKGAEKCFNQCITSVRQYWYKHFNTNQAKINFNTISLDELYECMGDSKYDVIPQEEMYTSEDSCRDVIASLVKEGRVFDAIVMDKICFDDVCKKSSDYAFDSKKLTTCLKSITENYVNYFSELYNVSTQEIYSTLNKKCGKTQSIKANVQLVLNRLKDDERVLSLVC